MLPIRTLLLATTLLAGVPLVACTTSTNGSVQSATINTADVNNWGTAAVNAATLVSGLPGVVGTPEAAAIAALGPVVKADLAAFDTATAGQLTVSLDSSSVKAAVASLLADSQKVLTASQAALGSVGASDLSTAQTYVAALQTVYSLFVAAAGQPAVVGVTPKLAVVPMTQAQALMVLGVK